MNVIEHILHFLWRLHSQDDAVGEDHARKVLTIYVNSFLTSIDRTDDGILQAESEELSWDVALHSFPFQFDFVAVSVKI